MLSNLYVCPLHCLPVALSDSDFSTDITSTQFTVVVLLLLTSVDMQRSRVCIAPAPEIHHAIYSYFAKNCSIRVWFSSHSILQAIDPGRQGRKPRQGHASICRSGVHMSRCKQSLRPKRPESALFCDLCMYVT